MTRSISAGVTTTPTPALSSKAFTSTGS